MVATPHPAATEAAVEILKQGGNAVDAAIAAAFVVSVAEQYHSGLGGGEFALVWRQGMETPAALDARECAPGYAAADMFIDRKTGQPDGDRSWKGGLAVGVPGSVKGRVQLHQRYGRLDWERVVAPAIRLARDGLVVNRILHGNIDRLKDDLASDSAASTIFLSTGTTPRRGDTLYQPTLARTLEQIALDQGASFYKGVQAKAIVRSVVRTGGIMTLKDLADYRVVWRRPLVVETSASGTASAHQIWTMSPPSSGGFCITLMLNILRHVPLDSMSPGSADQIHMIAQAMERAFADRAAYLGDPDFSPMPYPLNDITHGEYYEEAIDRRERKPVTGPGNYKLERIEAPDRHTSHISVIDGEGHMCALTTSVNTAFGSLVFVPELGIFLNNTMDDFATDPNAPNQWGLMQGTANHIAPFKRPLSSMSPTLVFKRSDKGWEPYLSLGAVGGPRIISAVLQTLINVIDNGMDIQAAIDAPMIHMQWKPDTLYVEPGISDETIADLKSRGWNVLKDRPRTISQGVMYVAASGLFQGATDARGAGSAAGPIPIP